MTERLIRAEIAPTMFGEEPLIRVRKLQSFGSISFTPEEAAEATTEIARALKALLVLLGGEPEEAARALQLMQEDREE